MTRLLALPGDGIGPEVTQPALATLEILTPDIEILQAPVGRRPLDEHGHPLSPEAREHLDDADAVLFGATETRPGEPSAVLRLREATRARLSLRPVGGLHTGADPLITVYRELTEGLYAGPGRSEGEEARSIRRTTTAAVEAFAQAALDRVPTDASPTIAHKATVLEHTDGLFVETIRAVADRREREVDEALVDALAHDLAQDPDARRHILAPNLYGDVLSDLAAGLHGGLGLAPSLAIGRGPPIAEPVHGTAPDIAGQSQANPTAMLASLALLLDELDRDTEARALRRAIGAALADPKARTPDLDGQATTDAFAERVQANLREVIA